MKIYQSSSFAKKVKKFNKKDKKILDKEIRSIAQDLSIGSEKKGDLRGIFIHKFKIKQKYCHPLGFRLKILKMNYLELI